jgi:glycerate dehydrogenase
MREVIIITDGYTLNPGDLSWGNISALGHVNYYDRSRPEEVAERCRDATIIVTNKTPIDADTLSVARTLKLVAVTATGYNIVDVAEASRRGILVCNVPGYGTDSVAQHTFALILELTNHVGKNAESVSRGEWSVSKDFCYSKGPMTELAHKTLGIIGYGQIGSKVAEIGRAFGMKILYSKRKNSNDPNASSVEKVFADSDVISLHCPLTADNGGFVNKSLLSKMKPSALLINTARGQLINENDLAHFIRSGSIGGAALDVLSSEPPQTSNPLIGLSGCIITPHNAWSSFEARKRIMEVTFTNISLALAGKPQNVVKG